MTFCFFGIKIERASGAISKNCGKVDGAKGYETFFFAWTDANEKKLMNIEKRISKLMIQPWNGSLMFKKVSWYFGHNLVRSMKTFEAVESPL